MRLAVLLLTVTLATAGCLGSLDAFKHDGGETTPAVEPTGRTVEINAWVENVEQEVWPGFTASFWAFCFEPVNVPESVVYNADGEQCSVPGPTLHVQQGDKVIVNFENPHDSAHTIHWHGQILPNHADGVPGSTQDTVEPGGTYTYEYLAMREGALMYHCHVDTQHHITMGLYGMIYVEPQHPKHGINDVDRHYSLMLSEGNLSHMAMSSDGGGHGAHGGHGGSSGEPGKQNDAFDVEYDVFMINGKSFPSTIQDPDTLLWVEEDERVRITLANIGFHAQSMHLHGHDMLVTHKDGKALSAPYYADTVPILPGERYDVIVETDNPGKWVMHTHFSQFVTNQNEYPGGMLTQLVYAGHENQTFLAESPGGNPVNDGGMNHDDMDMGDKSKPVNETWKHQDEITGQDYQKTWNFAVEEGVGSVTLNIGFRGSGTGVAGQSADTITVTLKDAEGATRGTKELDSQTTAASLQVENNLPTGEWTIEVTGDSYAGPVEPATYTLNGTVYYPEGKQAAEEDEHAGHGDAHAGH